MKSGQYIPLLLLCLFTSLPTLGQTAEERLQIRRSIEALERAGDDVKVTLSPRTGTVAFVRTGRETPIAVPLEARASSEARARSFLAGYRSALGLSRDSKVKVRRASAVDEVGMEHVRFQQVHRGIPVTGGELVVHLRGNAVVAASSKAVPGLAEVATEPMVSAEAAGAAVRADLDQRFGVFDVDLSEPRLEIFDEGLLQGWGRFPVRLAWFVEARATDLYRVYWVDALDGSIALDFSQLAHAKDRRIYDADFTDTIGSVVRNEGDPATGDSEVDDLYTFVGAFYDYFSTYHGRDSLDDNGLRLQAVANFCFEGNCSLKNASWNGIRAKFAQGKVTDDIVGHELTHGLVDYTADLYYYMQAGALNESYADIFGEALDLRFWREGEPPNDWSHGEESTGGRSRSFADPTLKGDPGKMSDSQLNCGSPGGDNGGVHTNSGIPNHAFYLMVVGGTYNGKTIDTLLIPKVERIQYRALAEYLVSGSDFLDNALALIQSCHDLIGTGGITSSDCKEVEDAIEAVEMDEPWACSALQSSSLPSLCPSGHDVVELYSTDFTSTDDFLFDGSPSWRRVSTYALTGGKAMRCNSQETASDDWLKMAVDITVPEDPSYLQFDHAFGFANSGTTYHDGGRVYASTTSGADWSSITALHAAGAAANGIISSTSGNPLGGTGAWVGDSYGFVGTRLNLGALAGQDVRFAWRVGSGNSGDDRGWFLDNVFIYSCSTCEGVDATGDTDHDDVCNDIDNCRDKANPSQDDADSDDLGDACDACPDDPDNDVDGDGVCGDIDNCSDVANSGQNNADNDEFGNACDPCRNDPDNDADGDGVCGDIDNCLGLANPDQNNADNDPFGDACDVCPKDPDNDPDGDGSCHAEDNCPDLANADQTNSDNDEAGDACDPCPLDPLNDADGDGFCADADNCSDLANPSQANEDNDEYGDACDPCLGDPINDPDGDGLCGPADNCPYIANADQNDADDDKVGDACDLCNGAAGEGDRDGDGFCDDIDPCPDDPEDDIDGDGKCADVDPCPYEATNDGDGDRICFPQDPCPLDLDNDADSDGLCADVDPCPADPTNDVDGDGLCGGVDPCPDDPDNDADGDGLCGDVDACPNDPDNDADGDGLCGDVDECPHDLSNDVDGDGICGDADPCPSDPTNDVDGDGLCGQVDTCPNDPNNDVDGDGLCGDVDPCPLDPDDDADDDNVCGNVDACPNDPLNDVDDDDLCGDVDACPNDPLNDTDGDGVCGDVDVCPNDPLNDADGDQVCGNVDACPHDPLNDADGDGVCGDVDACPNDPLNDADNDQICGDVDACPNDALNDVDGDGLCGDVDVCPDDPANGCGLFSDGFESGDLSAWS